MSKVFLIPNHHEWVEEGTIILTEEMLSWPIYKQNSTEKQPIEPVYKNALRGLLKLKSFDAVFCLEVNVKKRIFVFATRCWGWILLGDKTVKSFSHTKSGNHPFDSLLEWPEEDYEVVRSWTPDQWELFFIKSIKNKLSDDLKEAVNEAKCANEKLANQQKHTNAILLAVKSVE